MNNKTKQNNTNNKFGRVLAVPSLFANYTLTFALSSSFRVRPLVPRMHRSLRLIVQP
jgi:hypothetical protein